MTRYAFRNLDALAAALVAQLVPESVQRLPVRLCLEEDGGVLLFSDAPLAAAAQQALSDAGARCEADAPAPDTARALSCWAEALPLHEAPLESEGELLFELGGEDRLLDFVAELLRLGCDRAQFAGKQWVRATAPPFYSVAAALEEDSDIAVYASSTPGVWIAAGHRHPLQESLAPATGETLLIDARGRFRTLPALSWQDLYALAQLHLPAAALDLDPSPPEGRVEITLRLAPASQQRAATMWVLRENAAAQVETLLDSLPEEVAEQLLFAVAGDLVVLTTRPGPDASPTLELDAEAYLPQSQLRGLHLPVGCRIEPPLRADRLRELLVPDAEQRVWLVDEGGGRFRPEQLAEDALQPLTQWAEYVIDQEHEALDAWSRSTHFDLTPFIVSEAPRPRAEARSKEEDAPEQPQRRKREAQPQKTQAATPRPARRAATKAEQVDPFAAPLPDVSTGGDAERALADAEQALLSGELDADAARARWSEMAEIHARLGHAREARLCRARQLFDLTAEARQAEATRWAAHSEDRVAKLLANPSADEEDQRWLREEGPSLDARSRWLLTLSLSRASGGDALSLAHHADEILIGLREGLSLDRDLPSFLRGADARGWGEAAAGRIARHRSVLAERLEALRKTRRQRSAVEAPDAQSLVYLQLAMAWGAARLGAREQSEQWVAASGADGRSDDLLHAALQACYLRRIQHAREGRPRDLPLGEDIDMGVAALPRFDRYKLDQIRAHSGILAPPHPVDPTRAYLQQDAPDPESAEAQLEALAHQGGRGVEALRKLVGALLAQPPEAQPGLLLRALIVAGYLGRRDLVLEVAGTLLSRLAPLDSAGATRLADQLAAALQTLRRLSLRDPALQIIETLAPLLQERGRGVVASRVRLASARAALGDLEHAAPVLKEAHAELDSPRLKMPERLQITRALAEAWSLWPEAEARRGLDLLWAQLPQISDSLATNSHLCVSLLSFVEAQVLGFASDELAVGERGRRFLDAEEEALRARILRDLETLS